MSNNMNNPKPSEDWEGFLEQFQNESPRAAVIIGAAFLDEQLRQLIANFLVDEKNMIDDFLGNDDKADKPLSSFSSRMKAAYCLGLISRVEYDDLNLIRRIRNRFAHRLHNLNFNDKEIRDWCQCLQTPKKILSRDLTQSHSDLFTVGTAMLAVQIQSRAIFVAKERRTVKEDFELVEGISSSGAEERDE